MPVTTDVGFFNSAAEFLKVYGGWAMTVILLVLICWLFRYFSGLLEKRHDQYAQLLVEAIAALKQSKESSDSVRTTLERLRDKIE